MNTITFCFDNIATDVAVALLDSALYCLRVDARLLPNYRELEIRRGWLEFDQVEDPGINYRAIKPTLPEEMVYQVYAELYNVAVGKYKRGGFWCYDPYQKKDNWNYDPINIAREMNRSHMFDFHVSPVHVEQAQMMLRKAGG